LPLIATALTNPYPLVRYFAKQALEQASGRPVPIDVEQDPATIDASEKRWFAEAAEH
jgi:hypothetical protein